MKLVATIKDCRQYSEDAWEPITRVKEITPETTMQELIDWQKGIYKSFNGIVPMQILSAD
jgi:hypothetical protein